MEDIKGALYKITKTVTGSSGNFLKSTKMSVDLASHEEHLRGIYVEIGKKVHEIYAYGGSLGSFFDDKYAELVDCEQKIKVLKEQISALKGAKSCRSCGKTIEKTAEFCPKCGVKSDTISPSVQGDFKAQPTPPDIPVEKEPVNEPLSNSADSKMKCRSCHAENDIGTKFCLSCGRLLS